MRLFLQKLNQNFNLPKSYKTLKEMLIKKKSFVKENIKKTLKFLKFKPSLSADIWSDSGMQHAYLGVTLHFVNFKILKLTRIFLGLKELKDSHTGNLILQETESLLGEYEKTCKIYFALLQTMRQTLKKRLILIPFMRKIIFGRKKFKKFFL